MRRRLLRAIYTARWPFENVGKQKPRDPSANETRRTLIRRQVRLSPAIVGMPYLPSGKWLHAAADVSRLPLPQSPRGIVS